MSENVKEREEGEKNSETPVLDNFCRNITEDAKQGKIEPIIGRYKEVERLTEILLRKKKNNPMLIGEPGIGKTAIVEGLALKIIQKDVSRSLLNKEIYELDLTLVVAGTIYRGQFEERMKAIMAELEKRPDIILFIDEIHMMIGAGSAQGSMDASNILKPALARGTIRVIGATTINEFKSIEKDAALQRRFQQIKVEESTRDETIEILNKIKPYYESFHGVKYSNEAIVACTDLSIRYINNRFLPDKAIDAMDEAGAKANNAKVTSIPKKLVSLEERIEESITTKRKLVKENLKIDVIHDLIKKIKTLEIERDLVKNKWEAELNESRKDITFEDVAKIISNMSGVPITKVSEKEHQTLANLATTLKKTIIGQDEAVVAVTKSIQRSRIGMADPNKPNSFFFIGSSGNGKTQLCKQLAKELFGDSEALIRIDMSELSERHDISKLIGAAPGFVGYDKGGQLTDKVKNRPYSIVLLDEIEKAHPDVFNLLLQVLDDGHLTDGSGNKINFKNTVIVMTTNIGARKVSDFGGGVGFNTQAKLSSREDDMKGVITAELKKVFPPEFINRVDELIYFKNLSKESIGKIVEIELEKSLERVVKLGYSVKVTDTMKEFLVENGYEPEFGARPLKRVIRKHVEDFVTEKIIDGLEEGCEILVDKV